MNISGQLAGVPELMNMTSYASRNSWGEVLHHTSQHIGSVVVSISPDLSVSLDCLCKLGPARLPIRREKMRF